MQRTYFFSAAVAIFCWANTVRAAEPPALSACEAKSYSELVSCAEKKSSEIAISLRQLKSSQGLLGIAEQRINPELDADSVYKGADRSETNATLLFPIRLGGKRNALINEAKSEIERTRAATDLDVYQSRLGLMLSLYRLAHLKSELHLVSESIETYSKIVNQFQKRPALSPEQDVSLSVFKMAEADYRLRLTSLKAEEEGLFQSLNAVTGISRSVLAANLPSLKKNWPTIEAALDSAQSPQLRLAEADLQLARSRKESADSAAWPDIRIGPSVKAVKEGAESNTFIGVGLAIPLPVFSRNSAGRAYSAQRVTDAQMSFDQAKKKVAATRAEFVHRYTQTVKSIEDSLSPTALHGKHERLEKQFFKGLVPSALVIEAHRQLFELEQRRNSSELEALEALGRVLIIDGKFNEVIL